VGFLESRTVRFKAVAGYRIDLGQLHNLAVQDLPTRGLDSARNLCTVARITVLPVALAAHRSGCSDQLAFVRSFVPHLRDTVPEKPVL
jgi:hypothetical protein